MQLLMIVAVGAPAQSIRPSAGPAGTGSPGSRPPIPPRPVRAQLWVSVTLPIAPAQMYSHSRRTLSELWWWLPNCVTTL